MDDSVPSDVPHSNLPLKRCSKCGDEKPATDEFFYRDKRRNSLYSYCKVCKDQQAREWEIKNPEKIRAYGRRGDEKRVGKRKDYERTRSAKRRESETYKEYHSEYRIEHADENVEYQREYRIEQAEKIAKSRRERRKNPVFLVTERTHTENRRAQKKVVGGTFTRQDIQNLLKGQKGKCVLCKQKLEKYHIDHIVPLSRGGSNWPYNLQLLCPTCNLKKNNKLPHEFDGSGQMRLFS